MSPSTKLCAGAALAALLVSSCGIDQGGVTDPPDPQPVIVSGPITGFGSVLVNGLSLDTTDAQIVIDGSSSVPSGLRLGQMIRAIAVNVGGSYRAVSIGYQKNVVGSIQEIDLTAGTLKVLDQLILTDASTRYDIPQVSALTDLKTDDVVVISGLRTPSGEVLATYVGTAPAGLLEIAAAITTVDEAAFRFQLGNLTIDYSAATLLDLPGGMPAPGLAVKVNGTTFSNGVLVAEQVRALALVPGLTNAAVTELTPIEAPLVSPPAAASGFAANIAGFITAISLPDGISLDGVEVLIDGRTTVVGGFANDLRNGTQVRVEGPILGAGLIRASRITIR